MPRSCVATTLVTGHIPITTDPGLDTRQVTSTRIKRHQAVIRHTVNFVELGRSVGVQRCRKLNTESEVMNGGGGWQPVARVHDQLNLTAVGLCANRNNGNKGFTNI